MDNETKEIIEKFDKKITDFKDEIKRHFDLTMERLERRIKLL